MTLVSGASVGPDETVGPIGAGSPPSLAVDWASFGEARRSPVRTSS